LKEKEKEKAKVTVVNRYGWSDMAIILYYIILNIVVINSSSDCRIPPAEIEKWKTSFNNLIKNDGKFPDYMVMQ